MEIHKPKPVHSWKELLSEVGVVVIGIVIALTGEQVVEAVHRQGERTELREALEHETDQILLDAARVENSERGRAIWLKEVGDILVTANKSHRPLGLFPPAPNSNFDVPDDPIYRAAQSSGKLALLSKDEREAYSEMDALTNRVGAAYGERDNAFSAAVETQQEVRFDKSANSIPIRNDFTLSAGFNSLVGSSLSSQELKELFDHLVRVELKVARFVYWSRQTHGAAVALQHGERKLRKIEAAERQFDGLP